MRTLFHKVKTWKRTKFYKLIRRLIKIISRQLLLNCGWLTQSLSEYNVKNIKQIAPISWHNLVRSTQARTHTQREKERERELKMSNNTNMVPESYPMNGGDGSNSYTKNSYFQVSSILLSIFLLYLPLF